MNVQTIPAKKGFVFINKFTKIIISEEHTRLRNYVLIFNGNIIIIVHNFRIYEITLFSLVFRTLTLFENYIRSYKTFSISEFTILQK